jgi:hypothetical protein
MSRFILQFLATLPTISETLDFCSYRALQNNRAPAADSVSKLPLVEQSGIHHRADAFDGMR